MGKNSASIQGRHVAFPRGREETRGQEDEWRKMKEDFPPPLQGGESVFLSSGKGISPGCCAKRLEERRTKEKYLP